MSEQPTKPGPANPVPEGVDVPTPPGGPQRQDSLGQDSLGHDSLGQDSLGQDEPDEAQEENAGTSLDQPSDNSGGE